MFEEDYYEQYFELGKAIELNQKDKISVCAAGLYDEPDSPLRRNGDTALHVAAENGNSEIFMVIWKQILTSPHVKNSTGELPFHYACREGALGVIKIYVQDMKVSVDLKTPVGWTGLFYATFNNQIPVVEFLISKKAHINGVDKYYRSPLHWAAKYGFVEILKKLVEAGGDLDFKDKEGITARHIINNWEDKDLRPKIESIFALVKKKDKNMRHNNPS